MFSARGTTTLWLFKGSPSQTVRIVCPSLIMENFIFDRCRSLRTYKSLNSRIQCCQRRNPAGGRQPLPQQQHQPHRRFDIKPFEREVLNGQSVPPSRLWKPFAFAFTFSVASFAGVAIWEYETARKKAMAAIKGSTAFNWVRKKVSDRKPKDWRKEVEAWWNKLTPGERIFVPICALNIAVFGLWRVPRLQPFLMKYFASNPAGRAVCWPMFLSTFSHYSLFHILANMYVLHSFSNAAVHSLGREQFLGMYLSAGVLSTLASYVYKVGIRQCGPSIGASGAIMAVLALVCMEFPQTRLSILFLPNFTFEAGSAIKVIMAIDLAGCLLRWKFFDHAAHLGGAIFGVFWAYFGREHLWPKREFVLQHWHRWRSDRS